jgi:tellurite resistance protein
VFWRRAAAQRHNSAAPLRKVALASFCDEFDRRARPADNQPRAYFGECAVGSVELLGVLVADRRANDRGEGTDLDNPLAGPADLAFVEVKWSGTQFVVRPEGKLERKNRSAVSRLLLVLTRRAGVYSNADHSVSSAHCPNCGAPESNSALPTCEFCGVVLNDGSRGWALRDALPLSAAPARQLLQRLGGPAPINVAPPPFSNRPVDVVATADGNGDAASAPPPAADVLAWMIKMSCADGHIDDRERELLSSVATRHQVPQSRLDQMLTAAQSGQLEVPEPADRDQARDHLRSMASVALADGKITRPEYALLKEAGTKLGLSTYDVNQLIRRAKADLYAQAKRQLREQKRDDRRND